MTFALDVVEETDFKPYHNGSTKSENHYCNGQRKPPPMIERRVIAWDMEGISLSGQNLPQHSVLFGCSETKYEPLLAKRLTSLQMLDYLMTVAKDNPHSIHVGFGFQYDGNMILKDFGRRYLERIWKHSHGRFTADGYDWSIRWIPSKMLTVSRTPIGGKKRDKVSMTIYDYSSFFGGKAFLNTAEEILADDMTPEDREVIAVGKAARGRQGWEDIDRIRYYWEREIQLIRRVFEKFRDVMYRAGFALKEWYGPGALANFINAKFAIRQKLAAVQTTTGLMPEAVHIASKHAFSGGRFELFQAGKHEKVYAIDINSAYPHALRQLPSFDAGYWRHVDNPDTTVRFGIYRISYHAPKARPFEYRPMPLFWRDPTGLVSYPNRVHGWYYSPEARMVMGMEGVQVHEGWEWVAEKPYERPWEFLADMYDTRRRLGKKNLMSMPFKLGPNSLYGKYAQTVGWDQKKNLPPRSHALPVAGWVTSYCRSMLWNVIRQAPDKVIAVETDSVFMTVDPRTLKIDIGDELGQWGFTEYDELMYVQSGMYHTKTGDKWNGVRSRGMARTIFKADAVADFLKSLVPGEPWEYLDIETKPTFIGLGAALQSKQPLKMIHCSWRSQTRTITFGDSGKRRHYQPACRQCAEGRTPYEHAHRLAVHTTSDGVMLSAPRVLPWEKAELLEAQAHYREQDKLDSDNVNGRRE